MQSADSWVVLEVYFLSCDIVEPLIYGKRRAVTGQGAGDGMSAGLFEYEDPLDCF